MAIDEAKLDRKYEIKSAILVKDINGALIHAFEVWHTCKDGVDVAIMKIDYVDDGKETVLYKKYHGVMCLKDNNKKVAMICCVQAVAKYWKPFNIMKHWLYTSSGHFHGMVKVRQKGKKNARKR